MGFFQALGSALTGGAADLLGTGLSAGFNAITASKNRNFNREERIAAQQYQTAERIASQEYNTHMWEMNNKYNEDMYNKYQSPAALRRQYQAAGLNPLLAIDGSSVGSVGSVSSPAAGSTPQSITPAYNSGGAIPAIDNPFGSNSFFNMASALKALGDAKKTGIETNFLEDWLKERNYSARLANVAQELVNSVQKEYLKPTTEATLKKILSEIEKTDADTRYVEGSINILVQQGIIKRYEADHWLESWHNAQEKIKSETNLNKSLAAVNWDEHSMRDLKAELLRNTSNNQYSQSRLNYAAERVTDITGDMNELLRDAQEFKGERSKANPAWRRLSAYGRSLIESWVANAQILGLKGLGDLRNAGANPYGSSGMIGDAYKLLMIAHDVFNGHKDEVVSDALDVYNKFD